MVLEDLPKVYRLGEELFTAEKWPALYRTWDEYEVVEFFASDGEFCLVAVTEKGDPSSASAPAPAAPDEDADDEVIGFCLGTLIEKRHSAWSYGYLMWMGVDPGLKGRGIGRRLLAHLTDLFVESGARIMLVDTAADNEGALRFFHSQGFGHELEHVYLSRNLDKHPIAVQRRAAQPRKRPPRKSRGGPKPTEIVTPAVLDATQLDQPPTT
jgi:ribosomal protein S18 acetylase RimI-like enzyme